MWHGSTCSTMASACKVTAYLTSPPPQLPLGSVTGGHSQGSDTQVLNYQNPLVPNINTHENPKVMSTSQQVNPKDLPCTPCAMQQVVPMLGTLEPSSSHLVLLTILSQQLTSILKLDCIQPHIFRAIITYKKHQEFSSSQCMQCALM